MSILMPTRDSITDTFDYSELAELAEYQELCRKLSDFANETPEEMKFSEFLKFMQGLVAVAPFADNCDKCALNGENDRATWPRSGARQGRMLRGDYRCKRGHRWQCSYLITEWLTPDQVERKLRTSVIQDSPQVSPASSVSPVSIRAPRGSGNSRTIPQAVKIAVAFRDKAQCVYCGSIERLQYDHIIPWSKGGDSSIDNIQLLCGSHNASKRDKILTQEDEYVASWIGEA